MSTDLPTVSAEQAPPVRLTPQRIRSVVRRVCRENGLSPVGSELIKFTVSAVVRLPMAGAVLRIAGSQPARRRVPAVLVAARWFTEHDLPAVRLLPGLDQPLEAEGQLITVWQDASDGCDVEPTPADLAQILRGIHALPSPPPDTMADWSVMSKIRHRIAEADAIDPADLEFLSALTDSAEQDLADLDGREHLLDRGVVHGDAHVGNLISTRAGAVICDFDSTGIGPREWDLVPAAVGALRFAHGLRAHRELSEVYGLDVTCWSGFPALRTVRELQLVTSVLPVLGANPALRPQWEHRLATLRSGDPQTLWTPYSAGPVAHPSHPSSFHP
jgi:hypothetical protein